MLGRQVARDLRAISLRMLAPMPGLRFWRLGVWASGALTATGPDFHSVALWRQPAQMSLDYEALKGEDPLFRQSAASPGRPVRASARRAMPTGFRSGMVVPLVLRRDSQTADPVFGITGSWAGPSESHSTVGQALVQ